ncbi:MAG: hypothetical protein KKD56_07275 [Acidobacteria bacterium]|nr:hypothetical protein [Acidobacteriota bacterium]MCG2815096.1 hypothetical protein [Candidatus Aminicenantes bacterium]MBU1473525.1 hypothetical protein [Acidobacteriota bacterium]MBU2437596.1 hypothetical protein [Acidobacteriota bacterium]MBU4204482.1 hypothetical protein [Acidobacteriota bacterium]
MFDKKIIAGIVLLLCLFLLPRSLQAERFQGQRLVLGIGAGYGFPLEDWLSSKTYVLRDQIFFEEEGLLSSSLRINGQFFFNKVVGLVVEYGRQQARYLSHLDWYGLWVQDPATFKWKYFPIDHYEDPQTHFWAIHSFLAGVTYNFKMWDARTRWVPYMTVLAGFYTLSGDQEKVLDRFRLGPEKTMTTIKSGLGGKYRLNNRVFLTAQLTAQVLMRKRGRRMEFEIETQPREQFDYNEYWDSGRVVRNPGAIVRSFAYAGLEIGIEFNLLYK